MTENDFEPTNFEETETNAVLPENEIKSLIKAIENLKE